MTPETVVTRERDTYAEMWAVSSYHTTSPGKELLPVFVDMVQPTPGQRVLDAGCGGGRGALALRELGLQVSMCDITDAGLMPETQGIPFRQAVLWEPLDWDRWHLVYCCDVLEHIPTPFTMLVIRRLLDAAPRVFLSISLVPDRFGVMVGKQLHQTVQNFVQWRDQLACLGRVVEARDFLHTGVYLVERR